MCICYFTLIILHSCTFSMQDSLAHAVADEMQKIYQNELGPEPVPLTVTGEVIDEEEVRLFISSSHLEL